MNEILKVQKPKKPLFKFLAIIIIIISILYLINPTAGVIELIPDNIPFIGNIDEAAITAILIKCIYYLKQ
jgi:uncharacterized membrane protein YkvA (DUF1232 family)